MAFEVVFRQLPEDFQQQQFDCGRASLNEFLWEDACGFHKYGLTHTTLVYVQGDEALAAYFSLSSDGIRLSTFEAGELGLPFDAEIKYFPAVKITKLAVAVRYQRSGLGKQLLDAIQGLVFGDDRPIATRVLTVDAINEPDVVAFYDKFGFVEALEAARQAQGRERDTILMFKDIYAP